MSEGQELIKEKSSKNQMAETEQASSNVPSTAAVHSDLLEKVCLLIDEENKKGNPEINASICCDVLTSVKQQLRCPVCLQLMGSLIYCCSNGHPICSSCIGRLQRRTCAQCRAPYFDNRCLPLEAIAENWPFPCRFESCKEMVQSKHMKQHEDECMYFIFECAQNDFSGTTSQLKEHIFKCSSFVLKLQNNSTEYIQIQPDRFCYGVYGDDLFHFSVTKRSQSVAGCSDFSAMIFHFGKKSRTQDFGVVFKFRTQDDRRRSFIFEVDPVNARDPFEEPSVSLPSESWLKSNMYFVGGKFDLAVDVIDRKAASGGFGMLSSNTNE